MYYKNDLGNGYFCMIHYEVQENTLCSRSVTSLSCYSMLYFDFGSIYVQKILYILYVTIFIVAIKYLTRTYLNLNKIYLINIVGILYEEKRTH